MINVDKLPIVIIANYRTGSSELGRQLAKHHNVHWIPEPCHFPINQALLENCYNSKINYVTKFIVDQILLLPIHQQVIDSDSFKICLTRQDKLAQAVSYYIARQCNTWRQTSPAVPTYSVAIDERVMQEVDQILTQNDQLLDNLSTVCDLVTSYEELELDQLVETDNYKTTAPDNLDQVIDLAKRVLSHVK